MHKKTLLKIVNPILLVLAANQLATGFRRKVYGPGSCKLMHKQMAVIFDNLGLEKKQRKRVMKAMVPGSMNRKVASA